MKAPIYTLDDFREAFGSNWAGVLPGDVVLDTLDAAARQLELCASELGRKESADIELVRDILIDLWARLLAAEKVGTSEARAVAAELLVLRTRVAELEGAAPCSTRSPCETAHPPASERGKRRGNARPGVISRRERNAAGGSS